MMPEIGLKITGPIVVLGMIGSVSITVEFARRMICYNERDFIYNSLSFARQLPSDKEMGESVRV